ncbi:HugZ family protein [Paludibacterium purpuratum]|uniref:CREG-like beta-barrel domain-containing protein n=1 Tax=Paludibacterium purpuratum TaxID=1144873 RepID=A0A4R7B7P6_9NEIS|nr:pyridoxamine 5'-phosphate oxidase family protein [Paludibacterium purpuratum]TDR79795.1 hypothetical protein DFP86_107161 [Paludibacterium purpuratum]
MKIQPESVLDLLHVQSAAALATQSLTLPGYPFASALPFVPDSTHCPVFLISALAEHTRNLRADLRASLLIQSCDQAEPEASPRLTVLGDAVRIETTPALVARYQRYLPGAARYQALGDFGFYRLQPRRLRWIAGFGQMGWIEAQDWLELAALSPDAEEALLAQLKPDSGVLGIDCYGVDLCRNGQRRRLTFERALGDEDIAQHLKSLGLIG